MAYPREDYRESPLYNTLVEKADVQGYLTAEEILDLYSRHDEDAGSLHAIMSDLDQAGVLVLDPESGTLSARLDHTLNGNGYLRSFSLDEISTVDTVGLYLREMSQVPLLKVDEELEIAKRIEQAGKAERRLAKSNGRTPAADRRSLEQRVEDGDLAREHLIKANTRLVVSIAKKYIGRGVPLLDLIQEGNLGLMKAVEKYDHRRGFRFSTYATWWIRQTITRAIAEQGRTIRVPVHMIDRIRQMFKVSQEMEQQLGRPPTIEELAAELDLDPGKVQWMLKVSWLPLSLESPIGDDEDSELGMFVEDNNTPTPTQITYQKMLREKIESVLATLSPREARILRLRFGLENGRPYTLEEVGQKFGLTRERIRQIEGKALRRLRHPCRARQLREYL